MAGSFSITLDEFKGGFVNRRVLLDMVRLRKRALLQAHGEEIRRVVSRTLRPAKKLSLDAKVRQELGIPPKVTIYKPNPSPLYPNVRVKKSSRSPQNISKPWFAVDGGAATPDPVLRNARNPTRLHIGPPRLQAKPVPELLERGGTTTTSSRRRARKIGGGGEIRVDRGSVSSKTGKIRFGKRSPSMVRAFPDAGGPVRVVYIRLRTQAQVARSQAINDSLYRPGRRIQVQGRRYMRLLAATVLGSPEIAKRADRLFRADSKSLPKVRGVSLRFPTAPTRIAA
jgi:hypothetical protein